MIRLVLSGLSALVGVLSLILVISALSVVGFDDVTQTKPHKVGDGTYAVVFDQQSIPFTKTTATISADSEKPIMLGVANGVDSSSFLTGVKHEEITEVKFPRDITTRSVAGEETPAKTAQSRDWWIDTTEGTHVSRSFDVDGDPQTVVIAPTGENPNLNGTTIHISVEMKGVLAFCLMGIALSIIAFAGAFALFMWWRNDQPRAKRKANVKGEAEVADKDADPQTAPQKGGSVEKSARTTFQAGLAQKVRSVAKNRRARGVSAFAVVTAVTLSGCGLPVAQPKQPEIEKYTRPGIRQGEASKFLKDYSDQLDEALKGDHKKLDQIQTGPLLQRTRAEVAIAEKTDGKLSSPRFSSVLVASPNFEKYPMWFVAFGAVDKKDAGSQALLVTRESATEEWTVTQALFVPDDQVPGFEVDEGGSAERAPGGFATKLGDTSDVVAKYLSDGKKEHLDGANISTEGKAFSDFRDYVDSYSEGDNAFDKVSTECKPYEDVDLSAYTLATTDGSIGFGEIRCTLTLEVPAEYAVTLPKAVEAVKTSEEKGSRVIIETSVPFMMHESDGVKAVGTGWFMLESRTEKN